jgi:hypothetical protein
MSETRPPTLDEDPALPLSRTLRRARQPASARRPL